MKYFMEKNTRLDVKNTIDYAAIPQHLLKTISGGSSSMVGCHMGFNWKKTKLNFLVYSNALNNHCTQDFHFEV